MSDTPKPTTLQVTELPSNPGGSDIVTTGKPEIPDTGYLPLQDFMGLAHPDDEQKEKLQFIWDSFAKGRDRAETLTAIKEAKYRLSPPDIGEDYLHKLWAYTRLTEEGRSIAREKAAYEGTNKLDHTRP